MSLFWLCINHSTAAQNLKNITQDELANSVKGPVLTNLMKLYKIFEGYLRKTTNPLTNSHGRVLVDNFSAKKKQPKIANNYKLSFELKKRC